MPNLDEVVTTGTPCGATYATGAGPTAARALQASGRQDHRPLLNDLETPRAVGGASAPVRTAQGVANGVAGPSRPPSAEGYRSKEGLIRVNEAEGSHEMTTGEEVVAVVFMLIVVAVIGVASYWSYKRAQVDAQVDLAAIEKTGNVVGQIFGSP